MIDIKEYMEDLKEVQNRPENATKDIMSITAFMKTDKERVSHILRNAVVGGDIHTKYKRRRNK